MTDAMMNAEKPVNRWSQTLSCQAGLMFVLVNVVKIDGDPPIFYVQAYPNDARVPPSEARLNREQLREIKDFLQYVVSNVCIGDTP